MEKKVMSEIKYIFDVEETELILSALNFYNNQVGYKYGAFADLERLIRRS